MTSMQINLSQQPAPSIWGEKAILSAHQNGFTIHLHADRLTTIQKAARKIKNQNILNVSLVGEGWGLEECWAFQQGFVSVRHCGQIQYPPLAEQHPEFEARLNCTDFARKIINEASNTLTPEQLAKQATEFITQQAIKYNLHNAVKFEIIQGQALDTANYAGIWAVGKGSANQPALLKLDFNPTGDENAPVLASLVGKGITL
ncbi:aminopeptidase [[Haemophilus] ducreyi]|nr:aminopeptidase [[Haemophilus] ducreyi]